LHPCTHPKPAAIKSNSKPSTPYTNATQPQALSTPRQPLGPSPRPQDPPTAPRPNARAPAVQQREHEAGDYRADAEGHVEQREQQHLAGELVAGDEDGSNWGWGGGEGGKLLHVMRMAATTGGGEAGVWVWGRVWGRLVKVENLLIMTLAGLERGDGRGCFGPSDPMKRAIQVISRGSRFPSPQPHQPHHLNRQSPHTRAPRLRPAPVPKTVLSGTLTAASISVSLVACIKSGSTSCWRKGPRPLEKAFESGGGGGGWRGGGGGQAVRGEAGRCQGSCFSHQDRQSMLHAHAVQTKTDADSCNAHT